MKRPGDNRILAWLPLVLPVLGGFLGVLVVNLRSDLYLNPMLAVVIGVLLGFAVSALIQRMVRR